MLLQLIHLAQAGLAAHGARQSYRAITHVQKYEDATKKAAEYSDTAAQQLHKTRTTMTSGALAMAVSLLAALVFALRGHTYSGAYRLLASPAVGGATWFARGHIARYWAGDRDGSTVGPRVPLPKMGAYNEAQKETEEMLQVLDWLVWSWVGTSVVAVVNGF